MAFKTPQGRYQFTSLSFGLHGAAASFQCLANKVLAPHQGYAAAYFDDVIVYSNSWEEHLEHVERVLASIWDVGIMVTPEKNRIGAKQVQYLGFL